MLLVGNLSTPSGCCSSKAGGTAGLQSHAVRQLPSDFDSTVKAALDDAKALLAGGDVPAALSVYQRAWDTAIAANDHHHASIVGHMAGVAEPDPGRKVRWNLDALREADLTQDRALVTGFYASLYGNLAYSYAMIGDLAEALRYQELAFARVADIEPGPYRDRVAQVTEAQLARLKARIAEVGAG